MIIHVDKCKTFGVAKLGSTAKQIYPKLFVNGKTNLSKTLRQRGDNICVKRKRKLQIPWSLL